MSDWDDDDEPNRPNELDREWQQRREQHFNTGYREGLDKGKDQVLQQGFDTGFSLGCRTGYAWGLLQGAVVTLNTSALQAHVAVSDKATVQDMAQKLQLPHKQVMLTQCDAMLHEEVTHGKVNSDSREPPVISNAKPSAKELQALMGSVQSALQELGYPLEARDDMESRK